MTPDPLDLELNSERLHEPEAKRKSTRTNKSKGHEGEEEACKFVASLGYRIVKRNFRWGRIGEIDIVAYDGDELVFIEVKARTKLALGIPEAAIDRRKQAQLKRVARGYYFVNGLENVISRFDVIAIELLTNKVELRHHKNAFY